MSVTDINDPQQRRGRICEVVDWVMAEVPWTVSVTDWPGFSERWSALTSTELADVEIELQRRSEALTADDVNLDIIAGTMTGRVDRWTAAADWLMQHVGADIFDADFRHRFGELSRAELILAAIEYRSRLLSGRGGAEPTFSS
ncbi:hypothetical protein GGC65_001281 [Sphingopyxis sp. OAS728]|uniref:hypothetical protein n=1 Tax=Sphingopyxis sp. OAS728 TaxID=2663823 RepID=UPI0017898B5F|nr:hypothetical protein [Sphingopyxis sp. OAS728]MBE1526825.1 hypothetical protein [Sphingopyxis sp. OAS728]